MTWLRWETGAASSGVAGELAQALGIRIADAFYHYFRSVSAFGEHRRDGMVTEVSDDQLEEWAGWRGRRGRFAAAFRARCTSDGTGKDREGQVRGWWRQEALLRKQERDNARPPSHLRGADEYPPDSPDIPAGESRGKSGDSRGGDGDGDEDGNGTTSSPPPGRPGRTADRLLPRLVGERGRYAVIGFLDRVPEPQFRGWQDLLAGCLDGLGLVQGKAATVSELAAACNDYAEKVPLERWDFDHFRSFVDRLVKRRMRGERNGSARHRETRADRAVRAVQKFVARGES